MTIENGKIYKLINVKSGTALDLSGTDNSSSMFPTALLGAVSLRSVQ